MIPLRRYRKLNSRWKYEYKQHGSNQKPVSPVRVVLLLSDTHIIFISTCVHFRYFCGVRICRLFSFLNCVFCCFVYLRFVNPMLPMSLDCTFLIAPDVSRLYILDCSFGYILTIIYLYGNIRRSLFVLFIWAILFSVLLWFMDSDYPFCIFKLF